MSRSSFAGLAGVVFAVLTFAAAMIDSGPGGNYSASDVADYLRSGHRPVVFVAAYMALLGIVALLYFLAQLRDAIADARHSTVFWGLSIAGAAAFIAGWATHMAVPVAMGYGGKGVTVAPTVTYVLVEAGYIVLSAGAVLLGLALFVLVFTGAALPTWVRVITVLGALGAVAAPAFFPFGLFFLWALATGIWLLVARPAPSATPTTA